MFKKVLSKGKIGGVKLENRFVMPPMGSNHGEPGGKVGDKLIEYYSARARGGFGLIIIEFVCVDPVGKAIPGQLMLDTDENIDGFKKLADRIHADGSKVFMQIHHAGRQTHSVITGTQPVAPSPIPCPVNKDLPKELTIDEIYQIIDRFADTAYRAKVAGYDGVEIHGAHGYLVGQFMSGYTNKRIDEFGGDLAGRMKFPIEIVKKIKEKCGKDFPISFRISGRERVDSGLDIQETVIISKALEKAGVDAIHVSTGVYATMPYIIAPPHISNGYLLKDALAVKQAVDIPVIAVGRINDPVMAEEIIDKGIADFVSLGRAAIADAEFPNKVKENKIDEIAPCVGCLTRCQGIAGIDPEDKGVSCMINPFTGHELTMKIKPTENPKNIVVVGGGVGGLETAWVAAARGHNVTLFEKSNKLGGVVNPGCIPPNKHELARALRYYVQMCKKHGVNIKLNTEVNEQTIIDLNADEVIIATGSVPATLSVENEGIQIVQAIDILGGNVLAGQKVLIVGGGLVGIETAEYLLSQGRAATVIEMTDNVGSDHHPSIRYFINKTLQQGGVEVLTNTKVEKFTKDGAICSTTEGERVFSGYDMVALAVGANPYNPLEKKLKGKVKSLHIIGDAKQPRRIIDAVEEGARLALKL